MTNARPAPDGSGLLADLQFSGTVRSVVCDLTPGEETGAIHQAYASVNDTPLPQSVVSLQVEKGDTPAGQDRPYPYQGTFSHTLTNVPVTEGKNTLGLIVSDPLYHLSGTAEVGFDIDAAPPGGEGGAYASSTTVQLELPVPGSTLAEDEARLSIEADDTVLLDRLVLRRQAGGTLYVSEDGQRTFQFTQPPVLTPGTVEALHGYITLPQSGWQSAAFSPMTETEAASGVFTWSATEEYGGYWGWSATVAAVEEPVASGPGDFHPYTVRLLGPEALLAQVRHIHIAGKALPVVTQNGKFRVADALHPDQPVTLAGLPVVARQPPPIPEQGTASPGLVELGIGEEWEEQDIPEEAHDAMEMAMSRRLAQVGDGAEFKRRILRHLSTGFTDQLTPSFYGGFLVGFLDNPWSTGKGCCSTLLGIGTKVAEVQWLTSPLGMTWEFSFGDSYQGEIKAAVNTRKKVSATLGTAYDFAKEWGPEVCEFLANLMDQSADAVAMALRGEIPSQDKMGPEMQVALEVITQLILMADDAWEGIGAYERGYWQGYIAFEVVAVVVAAILSAPAGGSGGAAVLARHVPKVTRIFGYLEKLLSKFEDLPGIGKLVAKIRGFNVIADKLEFCFVAGTPVLTLNGLRPIEQVKSGDWVWSRDEVTGEWGWRPVVKTAVTHPDSLVHIHYEASGGAVDAKASKGLGLVRQAVPTSSSEAEIVCTPGHLVHARRSVSGILAAFVAAGSLAAGDLLTLADGRDAAVAEVRVEHAASGSRFTTYNFTVAGHHTYFAGALPVWVHNDGIDYCGKLTKRMTEIITKSGDDLAKYFDYLVDARNELDPRAGMWLKKLFPDKFWAKSGNKISQNIMDGVKDGTLAADKVPTVADWNSKFFKRPPGFDYKPESWANAKDMITRANFDLHHIIPKHIMNRLQALGIKPGLDLDATPGHLMDRAAHRKLGASLCWVGKS